MIFPFEELKKVERGGKKPYLYASNLLGFPRSQKQKKSPVYKRVRRIREKIKASGRPFRLKEKVLKKPKGRLREGEVANEYQKTTSNKERPIRKPETGQGHTIRQCYFKRNIRGGLLEGGCDPEVITREEG